MRALAFAVLIASCATVAPVRADSVEDFYRGRTLTIVVGAPGGGVYDLYARAFGKYAPRHIAGNPHVIVQNLPSSGSITTVNRIYNDAPRDGSVIGAPSNAAPFLPLLGLDQARFDPRKMLWLGSPTAETSVFFVWHAHAANMFDDLKKFQVIVGSNGPNASPGFIAKAMNAIFNTKVKAIYGYPSPAEAMLALQHGEIEGYTGIFWNQLKTSWGDLIRDKKLRFLVQFGRAANPELPGVPLVDDLIAAPQDRQLFAAVIAPLAIGYPLVMAQDIPQDRAAALLQATAETFRDRDFVNEATALNLAVDPLSGADVGKIIADAYAMSPQLTERLRVLYNAE